MRVFENDFWRQSDASAPAEENYLESVNNSV